MITVNGPCIWVHYTADELSSNIAVVQLTSGYTYERIFINYLINITECPLHMHIDIGDHITFPVFNNKSPSQLSLYIPDTTKDADIRITIEKFGQKPDPHYFDKEFDPILVTGDDGNEYSVIPSDQFK